VSSFPSNGVASAESLRRSRDLPLWEWLAKYLVVRELPPQNFVDESDVCRRTAARAPDAVRCHALHHEARRQAGQNTPDDEPGCAAVRVHPVDCPSGPRSA